VGLSRDTHQVIRFKDGKCYIVNFNKLNLANKAVNTTSQVPWIFLTEFLLKEKLKCMCMYVCVCVYIYIYIT
jgi:hypothetical protein